eukprot:TRINITY_DN6001_c0_g1_i1.p1 TRINITY_DN6001_c0_g1~~TRINITY_DN6001_c0_g1_i1.p1  ORF type:complete len:115 (-),score=23.42 TRINITY_DN6001_c0_g1_i1:40-384(-)
MTVIYNMFNKEPFQFQEKGLNYGKSVGYSYKDRVIFAGELVTVDEEELGLFIINMRIIPHWNEGKVAGLVIGCLVAITVLVVIVLLILKQTNKLPQWTFLRRDTTGEELALLRG